MIETTKAQLSSWHIDYCLKLTPLVKSDRLRWPTAQIFLGHPKQNLGGQYRPRPHVCRYAICYALTAGDAFREVVAHEVCHAFQRDTFSGKQRWHGEHFHYLMEVCGYRGGNRRCHSHNSIKAQKMHRLLLPYRAKLQNVDITTDCIEYREKLRLCKENAYYRQHNPMLAALEKTTNDIYAELNNNPERPFSGR
jgi:predicted SprT family Zn-dependent metalloprotease